MNFEKEFEYAKFKVMENTFDVLANIAAHGSSKTYDYRASMKSFKKFQNLKQTYGCIKEFANHLYNISKYFTVRENADRVKQIARQLNSFAESYSMLL